MSISAGGDGLVVSGRTGFLPTVRGHGIRAGWMELALVVAVFATMCFVVLSAAPQAAEPDDGSYHASIFAMTQGHFFSLSITEAESVARELRDIPPSLPMQWVELPNGRYISEKDPGYPFLAAPFYALGLIRFTPLFFGALACLGLFFGGRRWLGRFGGLAAVGLYCSSGAALAFAWRDFMPTFTDASLIAAGTGALLWTLLAPEATFRRRTWVGLAGFLALELATFVRYTDIVVLGCGALAVTAAWRMGAVRLRMLGVWLASVVMFAAGLGVFDDLVYGGPFTTGYRPGVITFGLGAIGPNLRLMPADLIHAMPMLVLGLIALACIIGQRLMSSRASGPRLAVARRDMSVGLALAASWFAVWAFYSAYTFTNYPGNASVQDVRFYVPAIGAISLLAAWLVTRIPGRAWRAAVISAVVAVMFVLGVSSFHSMYSALGIYLS